MLGRKLIWSTFRGLDGARAALRYALRQTSLGVRGLVRNDQGYILLVRHTYVPGWYFPGGGVKYHEPLEQAIIREMQEEAGINVYAAKLIGLYTNFRSVKSDHVAFFEITDWRPGAARSINLEIAEQGFFPPDDLPPGTTEATRRRLCELSDDAPVTGVWSRSEAL